MAQTTDQLILDLDYMETVLDRYGDLDDDSWDRLNWLRARYLVSIGVSDDEGVSLHCQLSGWYFPETLSRIIREEL